jgi:DMSO reductase anchor subunit
MSAWLTWLIITPLFGLIMRLGVQLLLLQFSFVPNWTKKFTKLIFTRNLLGLCSEFTRNVLGNVVQTTRKSSFPTVRSDYSDCPRNLQYFTVPLVVRTDSARTARTTRNLSKVRTESVRSPNKFRIVLVESADSPSRLYSDKFYNEFFQL